MRPCRRGRAGGVGMLGGGGGGGGGGGPRGPPPPPLADVRERIAVATRGEGLVNEHFGHAAEFQVYDVGREGAKLVGVRQIPHYCLGGEGEERSLDAIDRKSTRLNSSHGYISYTLFFF